MTRRKHIGQFSDFLRVSDGLIERVVEVVGNKNGKICVVGFKFLVGVTVDYGKIVVIVFLADKTARILAESANLVLERLRIAYQLRFVKNLIDLFHDLVSDLDAHADVNRAWNMRYIMFRANAFKPFRASSSGCDNGRFCVDFFCFFAVCDIYAVALVAVQDNIRAFITEKHFNAVFEQIFFNRVVKSLCLFSSEVTNGAVNKTQARFYGTASYIFDLFFVAQTLDVRVCTEFKIYLICVIYRFLRKGLTYQRRQISSDFAAEAQFSVGKCARARKTCRYMTIRLAVDAFLRFFFRAMPVLYRLTLFNDDDMLFASFFYQLYRSKNSCGTRADDNYIGLHKTSPPKRRLSFVSAHGKSPTHRKILYHKNIGMSMTNSETKIRLSVCDLKKHKRNQPAGGVDNTEGICYY